MSRRCELTAKAPLVGHRVSHSNIKTKRRFLPNLVNVTFVSETLASSVRFRVSTHALRSVDHRGGFDAFLLKAKELRAFTESGRDQAPDPKEADRQGRLEPFRFLAGLYHLISRLFFTRSGLHPRVKPEDHASLENAIVTAAPIVRLERWPFHRFNSRPA